MQAAQLTDLLSRLGMKRDGDSFLCPEAHQVTVYVGMGQEPLFIDRVLKIDVVGENLVLTVQAGQHKERYATAAAHVIAVRAAEAGK